jgi:hypothetical protein
MAEKSRFDAELETLRSKHGKVAHVVYGDTLYAFRSPSLDEYEDYQARLTKEQRRGVCYRELAQVCCLTDLDKLQALFKAKPAVAVNMAGTLCEMAGLDIELTVGKD